MSLQKTAFVFGIFAYAFLFGPGLAGNRAAAQLPSDSPAVPAKTPPRTDTTGTGLPSSNPGEPKGTPPSTGGKLPSEAGTQQPPPRTPVPTQPQGNAAVTPPTASGKDSTVKLTGRDSASPSRKDSTVAEPDFPRLLPSEYTDVDGLPFYTMHGKLPYRETHISLPTISIFGGALLALATTITWYQQAWYPDSTLQHFHFLVDWSYAREMDKIGHAYGGWMSAYCSHEAFIASGLSKDDALLWGSIGGLFFQTFMEVQDGFHSWGFDWTDEAGNLAGVAYFYAQKKIPFLQNFDFKFCIGPTGRDSARDANQQHSRLLVDDYDRQSMWLSFRVHNLLPESMKPYWPKWLQLALGIGARDVELNGYRPYRTVYLSLDYNLKELLPDLGSFGNWLVQGLNAFHFPAPALQLHPRVKFLILFPITL